MEDKEKLKSVLKFMKQTINNNRIMGADNLSQLYIWVDSAYRVHPNMKSQSGGGTLFGYRLVYCKSSFKKNTKMYTDS